MKRSLVALAVSGLLIIGISGCKSGTKEGAAPAPSQPGAMAPAGDPLSGKVIETMNSGGYTYVCIESSGVKTWVAMPQTTVKVGQQISCQPGGVMQNFTSKTLNRTFASIIFSPGVR